MAHEDKRAGGQRLRSSAPVSPNSCCGYPLKKGCKSTSSLSGPRQVVQGVLRLPSQLWWPGLQASTQHRSDGQHPTVTGHQTAQSLQLLAFFPCFESRKAAILILEPASGSLLSSLCSERQLWSLGRFFMEGAGEGIPKCLAHASSYCRGELCRPMPCSNPGSASSRCFLSWRAAGHCSGGGARGAGLRRDQPKEQSCDESAL